ncbi:MAG TPA: helix-turn-helix domain-containing protein [Candidatus Nanoarchaeia archaeon]|nr:helix-turn-helix domain-containing protein [Candidatus Nanoarchaeia archaeon]
MKEELRELGLSEYESKVYITLIKEGSLRGNKLSRLSGVPQGKVYDTVYRLSEKGFVSIMNSHPKIFKSVDPDIAINQVIRSKKEKLDQMQATLPKSLKQIKKITQGKTETDEKVSVFVGKKNAFAPSQYIIESASKSVDMMFTFEVLRPLTKRLLISQQKKGVAIRILATKKADKSLMKEIADYGFEVRYYPVEEIRIFIKDKKESVIQVLNKNNLFDRTNIVVQSEELSGALTHYFDKVWEKGEVIR